ncbi:MAG: acyloxyacyl hydrolase [Bacillota bacterium]
MSTRIGLAAALVAFALPAGATDVFVDAETGNHARLLGLGVSMPGRDALFGGDGWQVDQAWDARVAYVRAKNSAATDRDLWDVGLVPVLRLRPSAAGEVTPFAEAGIGVHLISRTELDNRKFSTAFQFGEHLAVGARFGAYAASLRLEHISNGSIKRPNSGMTFAGIELSCGWR